jgi:hypothetical protein
VKVTKTCKNNSSGPQFSSFIINRWTSSQPTPRCAAPCLGAGPVELAEQLSAEAAQDLAEAGAEGGEGGLAVPRLLLPLLPALLTQVLVVILRSVVVLPGAGVVIIKRYGTGLQDCGFGTSAFHLCCGSATFCYGSGSEDPYSYH